MTALIPALLISVALAVAVALANPLHTSTVRRLNHLIECRSGPPNRTAGTLHRSAGSRSVRSISRRGEAGGRGTGLRDPAMALELVAAMLESGAGLGRALELVGQVAAEEIRNPLRPVVAALAIGADWNTAWHASSARGPDILLLRDALGFAGHTGAPSAAILYAQAARIRRDRFRQAEKRAAALGVKLVIPLGLCSLPAFICLGVVPVLLALIPSGS